MANYFDSFNGEILKINYVDPIFKANTVLIPGYTIPSTVEVHGEEAYYWDISKLAVSDGEAGRKLPLADSGATRKSFTLKKSYGFGGYIPGYARDNITEDVVGYKASASTQDIVRKDNEICLAAMVAGGTSSALEAALTKENVYDVIVDAKTAWLTANKAEGGTPKAVIVSPAVYGELTKCDQFIRGNADFSVNKAVVGEVAGLMVIVGTELAENVAFIVLDEFGFISAKGLNGIELIPQVEGRVKTVVLQGEFQHGEAILDAKRIQVRTNFGA